MATAALLLSTDPRSLLTWNEDTFAFWFPILVDRNLELERLRASLISIAMWSPKKLQETNGPPPPTGPSERQETAARALARAHEIMAMPMKKGDVTLVGRTRGGKH